MKAVSIEKYLYWNMQRKKTGINTENSVRDLWDMMKMSKMHVNEDPEEKEKGA